MEVTVYTKPSCVQCAATCRALDRQGIEYEIVDLSEDPAALETVKELGYLQAPRRRHRRRALVGLPPRQDQQPLKSSLKGHEK